MSTFIQWMHWVAGFVVLAEALNKMARVDLFAAALASWRELVTELLKGIAWLSLGLGAGGAVATPLLLLLGVPSLDTPLQRLEPATLAETLVLLGFAVLIVRTRVKEG